MCDAQGQVLFVSGFPICELTNSYSLACTCNTKPVLAVFSVLHRGTENVSFRAEAEGGNNNLLHHVLHSQCRPRFWNV